MVCIIKECFDPVFSRNLCKGHYVQFYRGATLTPGPVKKQNGRRTHPLYNTWTSIKARCFNPNATGYERYGGRGIDVYAGWVDDAQAFFDWVDSHLGPRPVGMSLDRIDNDGNYEPGNLRWATPKEQAVNRRPRRRRVAPA